MEQLSLEMIKLFEKAVRNRRYVYVQDRRIYLIGEDESYDYWFCHFDVKTNDEIDDLKKFDYNSEHEIGDIDYMLHRVKMFCDDLRFISTVEWSYDMFESIIIIKALESHLTFDRRPVVIFNDKIYKNMEINPKCMEVI